MIHINDFQTHLSSLNEDDWAKLFKLIPEIEKTEQFGCLEGGGKTENGVFYLPHYCSAAIVDETLKLIAELGLNPVFDWTRWDEGRAILKNKEFDYEKLDTVRLCMLFTVIRRADRFSEGFLIACFENGIVLKIIKALQQTMKSKT